MAVGIVQRWITPDCLHDKSLKAQRELIRPLAAFVQYCEKRDPDEMVFTITYAETPRSIIHELQSGRFFILAQKDKQVVGALLFSRSTKTFYHTLFTLVDPDLRGRKIARNLTFALIRFVRRQGGGTIERTLAQPTSQLWHQKWAAKKPRVKNTREGRKGPVELVKYFRQKDYPVAHIQVFTAPFLRPIPSKEPSTPRPIRKRR